LLLKPPGAAAATAFQQKTQERKPPPPPPSQNSASLFLPLSTAPNHQSASFSVEEEDRMERKRQQHQ
jgi:hypothetical protein